MVAIVLSPLLVVGDILVAEYSPSSPTGERYTIHALRRSLEDWEENLPPHMRIGTLDGSLGAPFWASMLHFNYQ